MIVIMVFLALIAKYRFVIDNLKKNFSLFFLINNKNFKHLVNQTRVKIMVRAFLYLKVKNIHVIVKANTREKYAKKKVY